MHSTLYHDANNIFDAWNSHAYRSNQQLEQLNLQKMSESNSFRVLFYSIMAAVTFLCVALQLQLVTNSDLENKLVHISYVFLQVFFRKIEKLEKNFKILFTLQNT